MNRDVVIRNNNAYQCSSRQKELLSIGVPISPHCSGYITCRPRVTLIVLDVGLCNRRTLRTRRLLRQYQAISLTEMTTKIIEQ